jgi:hypothetical protein
MKRRLTNFLAELAETPMSNRRTGMQTTSASLRMRLLALGFLLGLASSLAVWFYNTWTAHVVAGQRRPAQSGA